MNASLHSAAELAIAEESCAVASIPSRERRERAADAPSPVRRHELLTTTLILANAVIGLLAQVSIATFVGVGAMLDAFLAVTAVPMALIGISASAFGAILIPSIKYREAAGAEAGAFEGRLVTFFACGATAIAIIGLVLGELYFDVRGPHAALQPSAVHQMLPLAWLFCALGLIGQILIALHHVRRRFAVSTMAASLFPLATIGGSILVVPRVGIAGLAAAICAGAGVQIILLYLPLSRTLKLRLSGPYRELAFLFVTTVPVALAVLPNTFANVSDAVWASGLAKGSLSYLGLASRLTVAVAAVMTTGIAMVAFPNLAELAAAGRYEEMRRDLANAFARGVVVLSPLAAIALVLRDPLLALLFQHGHFTAGDRVVLAGILPYYLGGMLFLGWSNLLLRAFYALKATTLAASLGVATMLLYFCLSGFLSARFAMRGIAIAYFASWALSFCAQIAFLSRRLGSIVAPATAALALAVLLGSAAGAYATMLIAARFPPPSPAQGITSELLVLALSGTLGIVVYSTVVFASLRASRLTTCFGSGSSTNR